MLERAPQMRLAVTEVRAEGEHGQDRGRVPLDRDGHPADGEADGGGGLVDPHADAAHERAADAVQDAGRDPLGEGLDEVMGPGADLLVHGRGDLGVVHGAGEHVGAAGGGGGEA